MCLMANDTAMRTIGWDIVTTNAKLYFVRGTNLCCTK